MNTTKHIPNDLHAFTGGYDFPELTRHSLNRRVAWTPGVKHFAEAAGAWWLIDVIASYQGSAKHRKLWDDMSVQFWTIKRVGENSAIVFCQEDSDMPHLVSQTIEFTDFPFDETGEFKLWTTECFPDGTMDSKMKLIILPSEY